MRDWQLTASDPFTLRLAADARLGPTDYADDHIWELSLAGGEPPALTVRTTYGLRAGDMRIFPSFVEGDTWVTDPAEFAAPPVVRAFFVNYIRLAFEPLPGVEVTAHYWAPHSHVVAGRFTLVNRRPEARRVRVCLSALLKPLDQPRLISPAKLEEFTTLEGHSGNLDIIAVLEGTADEVAVEPAPYPTLSRTLDLPPDQPVFIRWAETASPKPRAAKKEEPDQESLMLLRRFLSPACEWDGEFSRLELLNAGLLDIETGDKEWDAALAFAQTVALRCYVGPTAHLPNPSFVFSRSPDQGYSRKGDGSDHAWQWDGQAAMGAYVNLPQIVSAAPELAKGVLRNYLAVQAENGFIDWKPGLAGQRNRALCMPLLAALAWKIYEYTEDQDFLAEVYPGLRRFLEAWFSPRHDRDEDGFPEWSHTVQSAFDDNPTFVRWQTWAQGADISLAEAPDLAAYLFRECQSLKRMAHVLGRTLDAAVLERAAKLKAAVEAAWRDETASYHYVDRDTHEVMRGKVLAGGRGNLMVEARGKLKSPARILVKAVGPADIRPDMEVMLSGRGRRGRHRVETLRRTHVQWYRGLSTTVSEKIYADLENVEVRGLTEEYMVTISVVDYSREDQTLLLPVWAGIPDAARAETLIRRTILDANRYWRPYGLPACSAADPAYQADNCEGCGGVWLFWNTLIGEGLVEYGYRAEAAELISRLMAAMVHTLKTDKAFRALYNPDKLEGLGSRNFLWGVAPVALFMQTAGVRIINPRRVFLEGRHPFPWPVTIRHKGVTVLKEAGGATVTFPSGKSVAVQDESPQFVEDA